MRFFTLAALLALVPATASAGLLQEMAVAATGQNPDEPVAHPFPLETVVANMQAAYNATTDFTAEFEQQYLNVALDESQESSGTVHFLRPGMMRWDYSAPRERYFISDGNSLWIYEPQEGQYYTAPLEESELPTALRFLMGEGSVADDFSVSFTADSPPGVISIDLVPRESEGEYQRLRLVLDPTDWHVEQATIVDPVGNLNTFTFSQRRDNVGYRPGDFYFEPPDGAVRVEAPEGGI